MSDRMPKGLTVGNLVGKRPPSSGALERPAPRFAPRALGPQANGPAKAASALPPMCCGSGCAGCPFYWGTTRA